MCQELRIQLGMCQCGVQATYRTCVVFIYGTRRTQRLRALVLYNPLQRRKESLSFRRRVSFYFLWVYISGLAWCGSDKIYLCASSVSILKLLPHLL